CKCLGRYCAGARHERTGPCHRAWSSIALRGAQPGWEPDARYGSQGCQGARHRPDRVGSYGVGAGYDRAPPVSRFSNRRKHGPKNAGEVEGGFKTLLRKKLISLLTFLLTPFAPVRAPRWVSGTSPRAGGCFWRMRAC